MCPVWPVASKSGRPHGGEIAMVTGLPLTGILMFNHNHSRTEGTGPHMFTTFLFFFFFKLVFVHQVHRIIKN